MCERDHEPESSMFGGLQVVLCEDVPVGGFGGYVMDRDMFDSHYDPLTSPFLLGHRRDCDCDPAAHHRWNCDVTPLWAQTIRDTVTNPWTIMDLNRSFEWSWVWKYGHLCEGCGNPRYEGSHGYGGGYGGCV